MIRYLSLLLILVLSLGNTIRLEKLDQIGLVFWLSLAVLIFSFILILILTFFVIRDFQKPKRIRLIDLRKHDDDLW